MDKRALLRVRANVSSFLPMIFWFRGSSEPKSGITMYKEQTFLYLEKFWQIHWFRSLCFRTSLCCRRFLIKCLNCRGMQEKLTLGHTRESNQWNRDKKTKSIFSRTRRNKVKTQQIRKNDRLVCLQGLLQNWGEVSSQWKLSTKRTWNWLWSVNSWILVHQWLDWTISTFTNAYSKLNLTKSATTWILKFSSTSSCSAKWQLITPTISD